MIISGCDISYIMKSISDYEDENTIGFSNVDDSLCSAKNKCLNNWTPIEDVINTECKVIDTLVITDESPVKHESCNKAKLEIPNLNISGANSITKALRNIKRSSRLDCGEVIHSHSDGHNSYRSNSITSCKIDKSTYNRPEEQIGYDDSDFTEAGLKKKDLPGSHNVFICSECGKEFREKSHLATHFRAHRNERKYKCSKCELRFKTEVNLRFHSRSHWSEPLQCPHCCKEFKARRILSRHVRLVHSLENFECEQCGRKFKTRKNLICHYGVHSGVRPYSCRICSKTFLHKSSLNFHMREHTLARDCTMCRLSLIEEDKVVSKDDWIQEVDGHEDMGSLKLISLCRCSSAGVCEINTSKVHLEKPFTCSLCDRSFKLKSSLLAHIKSHTSSIQYKCSDCDKVFSKKLSYEIHMRRHRGERPEFMCDQCCQSYHTQFSLKRHYLKHTSTKNFCCQICEKTFWMKDALHVHMRSHTKERNFKCGQCNKNFSHKSSLVKHSRKSH